MLNRDRDNIARAASLVDDAMGETLRSELHIAVQTLLNELSIAGVFRQGRVRKVPQADEKQIATGPSMTVDSLTRGTLSRAAQNLYDSLEKCQMAGEAIPHDVHVNARTFLNEMQIAHMWSKVPFSRSEGNKTYEEKVVDALKRRSLPPDAAFEVKKLLDANEIMQETLECIVALRNGYVGGFPEERAEGRKAGYRVCGTMAESALQCSAAVLKRS